MANNGNVANKVCLIVIDGWGISKVPFGNAILNAKTPVMDKLCSGNWAQIEAHGLHVGLPAGLVSNCQVGHLNIGAGRVVYQDIVRINLAVKNNQLVNNENLIDACNRAKNGNGRLHLAGFVPCGEFARYRREHMYALIKAIKELGVPELYLHLYTSPNSGLGFLQQTLDFLAQTVGYGKLATVVGRWHVRPEKTDTAYGSMVKGIGMTADERTVLELIQVQFDAGRKAQFLKPIILQGDAGRIRTDDTLLFFDYDADGGLSRLIQSFEMGRYLRSPLDHPKNVKVYGMTQYTAEFPFKSLFPPQSNKNVLAEWLAEQKVSQFHCAETEKYAHVTFFFNGGLEKQFDGEERWLVPSPKVATYDLQPEMSTVGVADKMIEQLVAGTHPFIMCNFAPPDMVGHTGVYDAVVKACEATDVAIGRIYEAAEKHGYALMVTADHGNAEEMKTFAFEKENTCYRVPLTLSHPGFKFVKPADRHPALCDVAPTVLAVMGLPQPAEMTGVSIVKKI